MTVRVGVVGGKGLGGLGDHALPVETPWGRVQVRYGTLGDREIVFLARHGPEDTIPAHQVPHRAHVHALDVCHVDRVIAVHTAGALHADPPAGALVVPDGLVDATGEPSTFYDDERVHVDVTNPFCPATRSVLVDEVREHAGDAPVRDAGTYVRTRGPRLETPQEVDALARVGDVVGMTAAPEATLARERGLCLASLTVVANPAAGRADALPASTVEAGARELEDRVRAIVQAAARRVPATGGCTCPDSPEQGRLGRT